MGTKTDDPKVEAVVSQDNLGEAGGVAWVDIWQLKKVRNEAGEEIGGVPFKVSLTCRASNPVEALDGLMQAIEHAGKVYGMRPYEPSAHQAVVRASKAHAAAANAVAGANPNAAAHPAANPQIPAGIPAAANPTPRPANPTIPAAANPTIPAGNPVAGNPAGSGEATAGVLVAVKMTVVPRTDGKTKVEFYGAGRRYADLSATMTPDQLASMMQVVGAWTPDHFKAAGEYQVNYKVSWRASERTNQAGKPYKDIVGLAL